MAPFLDIGQHAHGFIAIGQVATGFIAVGQMATGVVAIGQMARGVLCIGQLSLGVAGVGMVSLGVLWTYGIGTAARGIFPIVPTMDPPRRAPEVVPLESLVRRRQSGFVRAELTQRSPGVIGLYSGGNLVPAKVPRSLLASGLAAVARGQREVFAFLEWRGETLICTRLNGHIVTEVRDSGPGLSLEVRKRLFEPFVTTKSAGTGLGLYVANRRVTELGGEIAYEEGPNGTSFIVKIPAS